jgi:2-polyprenyl-3-methyl-5-hydroxy-6-metoxy-1,4-benzoquinol methylase
VHTVVRCPSCGLAYTTPRLSPTALLQEIYDQSYWASASPKEQGYADYAADEPLYLRTFRRRSRLLRPFARPPGRVLDVGCAAGYYLTVAREGGWEVAGVEPSQPIAALARERLPGAEIHVGDVMNAPFPAASFDLVTLWDVVEHTPDPVAFVQAAAALVKPGGILLLETQNVDSLFARLLGGRWQHYKHREHLYHFNPYTLRQLIERKAGLRLVHLTSFYGGKYVSPAFIAERVGRIHPLLSLLLRPLARLKGLGLYVNVFDELVAVCRRPLAGGGS